jgi:hypothetical protein
MAFSQAFAVEGFAAEGFAAEGFVLEPFAVEDLRCGAPFSATRWIIPAFMT